MALEFHFVLALALVYGTSFVFAWLRRYDIPILAVEILAGIVFGATLGLVNDGTAGYDFFVSLAAFGLLMIMFDAGLELDPEIIRRDPVRVTALAVSTFLLPFAAGFGLGQFLDLSLFASFLTGVTVSTTSLGLIYPLLEDFDLLDTDRGQVILAVAVMNDILSVAVLAYGLTLATSDTPIVGVGVVTAALAFFFLVLPFALSPHIANTLRDGVFENPAKAGVFLMVALAFFLEHLGIHAILGAFFAGLLVAIVTRDGHDVEESMQPVTDLTAPVFFFYVGTNIHLDSIAAAPLLLGGVLVVGLGTKALGALIGGLAAGIENRTTFLLAAAMPGRLSISVAAAEIGRSKGIISPALYQAFVLLSVVSVFASVLAFRYLVDTPTAGAAA